MRAVVLPLVGMPTFRTPVFLWKILMISPMSFRRNGSPPVGRRNMRLPFPIVVVTLSISSSVSSCLRYVIDGSSQPGWAPSASKQCLHFALQASVMK